MKAQKRRWLMAAAAASTLLALLVVWLSLQRGTPATSALRTVQAATTARVGSAAIAPATQRRDAAAQLPRSSYIVQAASAGQAASAVIRAGGKMTADLSVIRAVGAALDEDQVAALARAHVPRLRIYLDATVSASSASGVLPETYYPSEVAAQPLQVGGVIGSGVTVAVVDSGLWSQHGPDQSAPGRTASRVLAQYDVIAASQQGALAGTLTGVVSAVAANTTNINDLYGHGTHVSSIIASSGVATTGNFQGVAPGVNLVSVRVLGANGEGTYANVISGIQWVIEQKLRYNIGVMNLSLSAPPTSPYWEDPLNQAVMAAWNAGIVVVVAAGNRGPSPMTIGVPGNVPYVITVGAITDNYYPLQPSQYRLASFSSVGPTYEGFVKPEVVAMGGHILAYAPNNSTLAEEFPQWVNSIYDDFTMSGTSMATAVTSGAVALMLQVNPGLTPDAVKCRLMSGAHPAVNANGTLAYSVFQQGAGLVNAHDAVYGTVSNCANQGVNVLLDLAGLQHYGGPANQDPSTGDFYITATGSGSLLGQLLWGVEAAGDGLLWNGSYSSGSGYGWSSGYPWSSGYGWSSGYPWSSGYTWSSGYPWSSGAPSSASATGVSNIPAQQ
jgi:serine protease AprX